MLPRISAKRLLLPPGLEYQKHLVSISAIQEVDVNTEFVLKAKIVVPLAFMPVSDLGEYLDTLEECLPKEL